MADTLESIVAKWRDLAEREREFARRVGPVEEDGTPTGRLEAIVEAQTLERCANDLESLKQPDGYVLVPVEATREMMVANWQFGSDEPIDQSLLTENDLAAFRAEWCEVIAAAPKLDTQGGMVDA